MKKLSYFAIIVLCANTLVAQNEIDSCVNDANTFPSATPSDLYLQNIPYSDSKFLNNWVYWMDPNLLYNSDPNNPPNFNIPIYNMGMNPGEVYGDAPDTPPLTGMMSPVNSTGFQLYYSYLSRSIVFHPDPEENIMELLHPQNGWELLSVNRGYYPDSQTTIFWPETEGSFRKIPYLLFYNKYTGVARVYVRFGNNVDPGNAANFADIIITHQDNDRMTGMLRLADGKDRTLDQKSIIKQIRTRVPAPGDASLWFSADFQMHYDPCVCHHKSDITVSFKFFTSASVSIIGRSLTLEGDLTNEAFNDPSFLDVSGVFNDKGVAQDGYLIYRKYAELMDDYLKKLNRYKTELAAVNAENKHIDRQIAALKIGKAIVSGGVAAATGMTGFLSLIALMPPVQSAYKKEGSFGKDAQKEFFKELDKALSIGFDLFVKENFEKKDKPNKPTSPTAAISEFHFTGEINTVLPASGPVINTPGSKDAHIISASNMPWEFPVYNEALGVFALLEKPKVAISAVHDNPMSGVWKTDTVTLYNHWDHFKERYVGYPFFSRDYITQFKLSSPLKYYINPALKVNSKNINVVFEVEGSIQNPKTPQELTPAIGYNQVYPHNVTVHSSNSPELNVNIESVFFDPQSADTIFRILDESNNYEHNESIKFTTISMPLEGMDNAVFSFAIIDSIKYPDVFRHRHLPWDQISPVPFWTETLYQNHIDGVPLHLEGPFFHKPFLYESFNFHSDISHLYNSNIGCTFSNGSSTASTINPNFYNNTDFPTFKIEKLTMKLLVDIEFDDIKLDGTPQHHSYLFSYNIDLEDVHDPQNSNSNGSVVWLNEPYINPNLVGSPNDYTQFDEVSIFNSVHFDGSIIENCILSGTHYDCKGRYAIEIEGDITVASGYTVKFIAPETIIVMPESNIAPEVELVIESVIQNLTSTPPQSSTEVQSFCTAKYEAKQLQRSLANFYDSIAQANPTPQPEPAPIEFIVFPNPTTGASQAGLVLPELSTVSISIIDITGKVQGRPVRNQVLPVGRNVLNLESEPLAPGVYFVQVVVNGEKLTQRLVKQ